MTSFRVGGIGGDCDGLDLGFSTPEKAESPPATPDSGSSSSGTGKCFESINFDYANVI